MSASLGSKIGSYGLNHRFILQQFVIWGIIVYVLVFGVFLRFPPFQPAVLLIWLALYLTTVVGWSMVHPLIIVHDRGVMVVDGSKRSTWQWHELSRMDGTRHTYSVNGIPIARWGANQFYASKSEAFRVGAWTADADALVDFILMKMSELRIPAEIKKIQGGSLLSYGKTHVTGKGIEKNGQFYNWSEVRGLKFQYWTETAVTLELKKGKSVRLDSMEGLAFYSFVGVVDHYLGSKYSHEIQQDRIQFRRRMKHTFSTAAKVTAIVVGLTILGIAAITGIYVVSELAK